MNNTRDSSKKTADGRRQTAEETLSNAVRQPLLSSVFCRLPSVVLFLSIAVAGLSADLFTKHWAFQTLERLNPGEVYWIWQDVFGFQTSLNTGALFGIMGGQITILVALSIAFLTSIAVYLFFWAWRSWFLTVILGMITAGICGNLYDRLGWHGLAYPDYPEWHELHPLAGEPIYAVRDWILCMIGTFHWPNFNIADCLLVCSVVLLLLYWLFFEEKEERSKEIS